MTAFFASQALNEELGLRDEWILRETRTMEVQEYEEAEWNDTELHGLEGTEIPRDVQNTVTAALLVCHGSSEKTAEKLQVCDAELPHLKSVSSRYL